MDVLVLGLLKVEYREDTVVLAIAEVKLFTSGTRPQFLIYILFKVYMLRLWGLYGPVCDICCSVNERSTMLGRYCELRLTRGSKYSVKIPWQKLYMGPKRPKKMYRCEKYIEY